jgi:hypothetical protein
MKKSALIITLISFLFSAQAVFAQSAALAESSLTAIPPRLGEDLSLRIKPGEKLQTSVRVRNGSSQAVTTQSLAQDFIVDLNGGTPIPIEGETSNRWSLSSWLMLTPSVQVVQPGKIATINIVIDVPADALPGGHYAMITHQPNTGGNNQDFNPGRSSAASLQQRVGTLLYVTVDGPINEAAFIRELKFPKFSEFGPVPFTFTVDNQSDIHISPQVGVEIYNLLGRKVETIELETKNVFPFIARDFEGEWDRIWGFGPYTAKAVMSYGTSGQLAIATTSFWLLPVTLLLAALIVLMVLVVIIIVIRRHLHHRRGNQQNQIEMLENKVSELEQEKLQKFDN